MNKVHVNLAQRMPPKILQEVPNHEARIPRRLGEDVMRILQIVKVRKHDHESPGAATRLPQTPEMKIDVHDSLEISRRRSKISLQNAIGVIGEPLLEVGLRKQSVVLSQAETRGRECRAN